MGTTVRKAGEVAYDDLPGDIQDDLVAVLSDMTGESEDDAKVALENGTVLPLVWVKAEEIHDPNQRLSEMVVERYAEDLADGDRFPPVVIDSSKGGMIALQEGRHRTAAAVQAGILEVLAIDVARPRIVKKVYAFGKTGHEKVRSSHR